MNIARSMLHRTTTPSKSAEGVRRWLGQSPATLGVERRRGEAAGRCPGRACRGIAWPFRISAIPDLAGPGSAPATALSVRRRARAGSSLVELLVVISVNSVLMGVAAVLLGTLLRTDRQGQHHFERTGALLRLTEQLHTDIAAAREASTVAGAANEPADPATSLPPKLRLQGAAGQAIEYWRDGDRVRRTEYQDRAVVRREAYTLANLTDAEFMLPAANLAVIRLTVSDAKGARDVWNIESRVAKDWRFATEDQP